MSYVIPTMHINYVTLPSVPNAVVMAKKMIDPKKLVRPTPSTPLLPQPQTSE